MLKEKHPKNNDGVTPLQIAAKYGHSNLVEFYLGLADKNHPKDINFLLKVAFENGQMRACEVILDHIVHETPEDINGDTVLHYAADNI